MPIPQSAKSKLIDQLSSFQLLGLIVSTVLFGFWLQRSMHSIVRDQIVGDGQVITAQMAELISQQDHSGLDYESPQWNRIQSLVESVTLPNDGYICVVGARDGKLLCHPKMRSIPDLRGAQIGDIPLTSLDGNPRQLLDLRTIVDNGSGYSSNLAGSGDSTEVISAAYLPSADAILLVHQMEIGMRQAVRSTLIPTLVVGAFLVFATIALLKRLTIKMLDGYESELAKVNEGLEETVRTRTQSLVRTRDSVIFGLAKLAESRDSDTGAHLERIRTYVTILAKEMGKTNPLIDEEYVSVLGLASSLHDIGKVGVPDAVLLKAGKLTQQERSIIEQHTLLGKQCLEAIGARLGEDNFLEIATDICAAHHEKWDGSGYPNGLSGVDIPLPARIIALADVYDALTSRRPYKDPMSHERAKEMIVEGRGSHFDPDLVDCFLRVEQAFEEFSTAFENCEPLMIESDKASLLTKLDPETTTNTSS